MKSIDIRWGSPGVPLLPQSLRELWKGRPLPAWLTADLKLPIGSTAAMLGQSLWMSSGAPEYLDDRPRNFLLNLMRLHRSGITKVKVFTQPVPYWLELDHLPFSTRTRNCLAKGKLLGERERLSSLTFGDLFDIQSMGVVSILEFACTVEAAIERSTNSGPEAAAEDNVLEIVGEAWAVQIGPADPRFSDLIPPMPQATVLEMLDVATSSPDISPRALAQLSHAMPRLRERLEHIRSLPLEGQLLEFLRALSRFDGKRLQALADRFGWGGRPPITLEAAGEQLGITRERVRQLQDKVSTRLNQISFTAYMPALDAALLVLADESPLSVGAASALLKKKGISSAGFHPASVIAAAVACGRKPPIKLQTINNKTIVARSAMQNADAILRVAYRQAHASGATNIDEVVAELSVERIPTKENIVRQVLREFSDVEFLGEDWFCHRPANPERDRLRNVTRKMLSVASPIDLGLIREGLRREYRFRRHRRIRTWSLLVPPRWVLRGYYETHPEFVVEPDDKIKPAAPLDYRDELALNEAILVDVLRSSPACVLDRASFATECIRRSMNVNTFSIYSTYSPIVQHLGVDIWSLRGVRVDPAAVEAVRTANALRQKEKRVLDHGWTPIGQLWLAARIPNATNNLVIDVPGAIRRYLAGRQFDARDEDGVAHGSIRVTEDGTSYGFGRFLRQRGADEGDILIAEFDLGNHLTRLRLGDDELLEEMSPEA